jgi:hypothetical protein
LCQVLLHCKSIYQEEKPKVSQFDRKHLQVTLVVLWKSKMLIWSNIVFLGSSNWLLLGFSSLWIFWQWWNNWWWYNLVYKQIMFLSERLCEVLVFSSVAPQTQMWYCLHNFFFPQQNKHEWISEKCQEFYGCRKKDFSLMYSSVWAWMK